MNKDFLKGKNIIHRGLINQNVVENTIPAIIKCVDNKFPIEIDIHVLMDDTIVVYHDFNLKRMCGVNKILETLNYTQLSKFKIKKKYTIPTLKQVMHIVAGKVPMLIEIKSLDNNIKFNQKLSEILDNYKGDFAIISFNPSIIDWFHKNKKEYAIGLIIFNSINYKFIKKYYKKVDFLCVNKKLLPFKLNKLIVGWTIKSKEELKKYIQISDSLICENIL